jgi:arabinogalactan endo-1,4-beta-galactosidase
MRISSAFPSDYLKAADLQGRAVTVTMSHVDMREVGGEPKPILYFQGKEKGMVLNKTNASKIAEMFGDDTDDWAGGEIILYEAMVDYQGKTVAALRVRLAPRKNSINAASLPNRPTPPPPAPDTYSDDIPF